MERTGRDKSNNRKVDGVSDGWMDGQDGNAGVVDGCVRCCEMPREPTGMAGIASLSRDFMVMLYKLCIGGGGGGAVRDVDGVGTWMPMGVVGWVSWR